MQHTIRIAIQKSGRLSEDSIELIRECDIRFNRGQSKLKSQAFNFPIEFLFLRDDDIPRYVADNVADLGIVGENVVVEEDLQVEIIDRLGFSKCRISIALPKSTPYHGVENLEGLNIATSYPRILANFLQSKNITASIHEISGSVEIAPSIGLAEAVCDIVSSGSTLISNGLREVEKIFHSEAVLIANENIASEKQAIVNDLIFRIKAVLKAQNYQYILLNAPNDAIDKVIEILPGMKSPSVLPLAQEGWSSVHSVINKDRFWEVIESLKAVGAQGILVVPIEKMIV
ncbi:MAG: ATP phosphoribosyltransferase [bacterium]